MFPFPPICQLVSVGQSSGSLQLSSIWSISPQLCSDQHPRLLQWEQLKEISENNTTARMWQIAALKRVCRICMLITWLCVSTYRCKPGFFNLLQENPAGCQACFCFGHSLACSSSGYYAAVNITSDFTEGNVSGSAAVSQVLLLTRYRDEI